MTGANLHFADLRDTNLRSANLAGADLRDANLSGADLANANLTDVYGCDKTGRLPGCTPDPAENEANA